MSVLLQVASAIRQFARALPAESAVSVRMNCASGASAAAGMHAGMLSLKVHKVVQPAQLGRL